MKNVILVPKDKCPLDALAKIGETAWIFLHKNAVKKLRKTCNIYQQIGSSVERFFWDATDQIPEVHLEIIRFSTDWFTVLCYNKLKYLYPDPEEILLLKMAE